MRNEQAAGSEPPRISRVWPTALACFIIAGSGGSLLRFGVSHGFPSGLLLAIGLPLTIRALWPSLSGRWVGWRMPLARS
jgi:hypothetical protein